MGMGSLSNIGSTISASIHSIGYFWFAVMILINIVLYRIHPILGFLGTLFLFGWMTGLIG
ncbi:MAG: hypothetical protein KA052_00650 [Candidatus Pacebacteria bacterium]|nr:hypothetical protein [Candidatus Paceibacterota bacterium]